MTRPKAARKETGSNMDVKHTEIFESKSVPRAVAALTGPTVLSQVILLIYNLADTFFVGHTGDASQVAALTLCFPLFMMLSFTGNLFGIGANSAISRSLGAGDEKRARRASAFSFWGGMAATALLIAAMAIWMRPILYAIGASDMTVDHTAGYLSWVVLIGGLPTEASFLIAHALRGEGRTKEASTGMMLGGAINIILDPVFIFLFRMGVSGAGLATMLSNCACLIYYIIVLHRVRGKTVLTVSPRFIKCDRAGEIILVGLPAAIVVFLGATANIVMTRTLSTYSDLAVAAYGVTQKFGIVTMNITVGITQGVMPLIGYNYAAGNYPRVRSVVRCSVVILLVFVALMLGICQLFPVALLRLFVSDAATVELGAEFLTRWSVTLPAMAFVFLFNSVLQAMGKWVLPLLLTVLRQAGLFIPIMLILNRLVGLFGLIWAQPIADAISLILGVLFYAVTVKKALKE